MGPKAMTEEVELDIDKLIALERYQAQRETEERVLKRIRELLYDDNSQCLHCLAENIESGDY